jgi:hypothetical protein
MNPRPFQRLKTDHLFSCLPASVSWLTLNQYNLIYIQQDATLHSLFYLETALHVSGGTITHHQQRKQLSTASGTCLPRWRQITITALQIPDAVDTVVCAPDDG